MIRVLLADDHSIVRAGLRRLVEESEDIEVVAEAADGHAAIHKAQDVLPDVAVIDISMRGMDGLEVINQLQRLLPDLPVLVLTMHEEERGCGRLRDKTIRTGGTRQSHSQGS